MYNKCFATRNDFGHLKHFLSIKVCLGENMKKVRRRSFYTWWEIEKEKCFIFKASYLLSLMSFKAGMLHLQIYTHKNTSDMGWRVGRGNQFFLLLYSAHVCNSQCWDTPKPGTKDALHVSYVDGRLQELGPSSVPFLCVSRKLNWNCHSNMGLLALQVMT